MLNVPEDSDNSNIITSHVKSNFNGSGSEYAKIWFSNLALKILTLGIYGPWAKVRKTRYLYANTEVAGHNFDYTADPKKIFIGRAIVFSIFIIYSISQNISIYLAVGLFLGFFIALPWFIKKSLQFKMRYSEYRGISFRHKATALEVFLYIFLLKALTIISFGLLAPLVTFYQKKFIIEKTSYGNHSLSFNGKISQIYLLYLVPLLLALPVFALFIGIALLGVMSSGTMNDGTGDGAGLIVAAVWLGVLILPLSFGALKYLIVKYTVDSLEISKFSFYLDTKFFKYVWIVISNLIITVLTLGIAYPWCFIRARKYFLDNIYISGNIEEINSFTAATQTEISALGSEALDLDGFDFEFSF